MTESYEKDQSALARLTPRQYAVTQEGATEPAFNNEFGTPRRPGSTSTSFPESPSSPPSKSSTAGRDGRASRSHLNVTM